MPESCGERGLAHRIFNRTISGICVHIPLKHPIDHLKSHLSNSANGSLLHCTTHMTAERNRNLFWSSCYVFMGKSSTVKDFIPISKNH